MRTYHITITGTQPLLMHHDDIDWADKMDGWKLDKDNKAKSKAGDDRTPAHRWMGCLYRNENGEVILPTENIMRSLMEGGAMVLVPGALRNKTFKSQSQSGIMPRDIGWQFLNNGKPVDGKRIDALLGESSFAKHEAVVADLGFTLFKKRAKIGSSKHIRVRPRFDKWSASGDLIVTDDQITGDVLTDIFERAGKYKGLGDWRPGGKTPGTYGMFEASVTSAG
jgi:hypothetical protein